MHKSSMETIKLELANSLTRRVCNDIIVDYNVFIIIQIIDIILQ